jgi:RNA polymerase sigma factor (TIGR02999 family)
MSGRFSEITRLLQSVAEGQEFAADELFPLIYGELRGQAVRLMASERKDHTLQPTALVHEAFLKVARPGVSVNGKLHFYRLAAQAMRRILVDHAAARNAGKRGGGGAAELHLEDTDAAATDSPPLDMLALNEAMESLRERSQRQHEVVMLRFFGGLKDAEIAALLDVNEKTVRRDWQTAKLWLRAEMSK